MKGLRSWHRSLLARFIVPTALILILCVGAIALVTHLRTQQAFSSYVTSQQVQELTTRGRALALTVSRLDRRDGNWMSAQQFLEEQASGVEARLLVVDAAGQVAADSERSAIGETFVPDAADVVIPIRRPLRPGKAGQLILIPTAGNPRAQGDFLSSVDSALLLVGSGALLAALVLAYLNVRRITAPLRAMTAAAVRLAGGDLAQRVPAPGTGDEVSALAVAFNQMAAGLEETQRQRRVQTADIAHELRTPLTSVRGYLEAIQDGAIEAGPAVIDSMHEEVLLLGGLLGDLQDLALADAGQLRLHRLSQPLAPLLEQAVEMQAVAAREHGITLDLQLPDTPLPDVPVDGPRLSQVLRNLIANALAHTPSGGSVTAGLRAEADAVEISVRDTGQGIEPEHLPHIFDRFYRADPSRARTTGGHGIGLSVAKSIVQAHGGVISVRSTAGEGTEFCVRLHC